MREQTARTFHLEDIRHALDQTTNPFEDHWYYEVAMPYGQGFGRCWTVADEQPSREWVLERIQQLMRQTSYEIACGRMLGGYGLHLTRA